MRTLLALFAITLFLGVENAEARWKYDYITSCASTKCYISNYPADFLACGDRLSDKLAAEENQSCSEELGGSIVESLDWWEENEHIGTMTDKRGNTISIMKMKFCSLNKCRYQVP